MPGNADTQHRHFGSGTALCLKWGPMLVLLLSLVLGLFSPPLQAQVGITTIAGLAGDGPVTLFFPTATKAAPLQIGPFTLQASMGAAPQRGNGRLVVVSHGSGGAPWVSADLAAVFVQAGFVVAMPEHRGDNHKDPSKPGPQSWQRRPAEVSRAIDALAQDPRWAALLRLDKVGVYGMSAGGHTALSFAGGRWSPALFNRHCQANIEQDFHTCVGLATQLHDNWFDSVKITVARWVLQAKFGDASWQTHKDARVAAVVAAVPLAADFDLGSLAQPSVPLGLVEAAQDAWLKPRFHSEAVLKACARCERVARMERAGHGALLSPFPPDLKGAALRLLQAPPGFERSELVAAHQAIVGFFVRHLGDKTTP